MLGIDLVSDCG